MALRFAYNTNGTVHHRMEDAVALIADSFYDGIALTLDHHVLDPMNEGWQQRTETLARTLSGRNLGVVIESGARFVLDPRDRHQPTLVSAAPEGRALRLEYLRRCLDIGAMLGAEVMSFWAGALKPGVPVADARIWLDEGVEQVLAHAERVGVPAAMEPEPEVEVVVRNVDQYAALQKRFPSLELALDLGHVMVTQERVPEEAILEFDRRIGSVSLEDMKRGVHQHLAFGDGDMNIPACLDALEQIDFRRLVCVELSSDSGRADTMVPHALEWIRACRRARAAA
ncbi:sugar phosphate isomerase/epimerase family protein [Lichenicoccus roseus]|uniref:TIM barrel protein n=1 Tax=Lichenicoccus roseus TaxID=2683649 RepID=A0A5R9J6C9_9PROT|nr:sugar phosphate isomerase/epimerase family protein [Lichenicoccus roseus]TLU70916.1 TIM barrel protein [Lichenicoccus roseus]